MKAIQAVTLGKPQIVNTPNPDPENANTILVRTRCLGCNPCDVICSNLPPYHKAAQILGCDYSGIVEKVGANLSTSLKPGDRVCGPVAGGVGDDISRGAFAELVPAYGE
jgi:NADPH:quinone reductase-like Zn-dependent oxidoreductase